jgi:hypothetical protein
VRTERSAHCPKQNITIIGLLDEINRALPYCFNGKRDIRVTRDHDHGPPKVKSLKAAQEFNAIDFGHPDVSDDTTALNCGDGFEEGFCIGVGARRELAGP